jgi:hypothetical protein
VVVKRRLPGLVLVLAALAAIIATTREPVDAEVPMFSAAASGWMPSAGATGGITETWFCPGVPATGGEVGGELLVANRGGTQLVGTVRLIDEEGETRNLALEVDGWSSAIVDLDGVLPSEMVGAVVEIEGGGAIVEQRSLHPDGNSAATCANATSDTWYLADGFTVEGSLDQVILANPYEQTVVANLEFSTREGSRSPDTYRGLTVPAESIRVINLGAPGAGAQNEPVLAVRVQTTRGRLVVGRFQHYLGGGRNGAQVTLAAPELADQWWFTGGRQESGVDELYSIYNASDDPVTVDTVLLGVETGFEFEPIEVDAGHVATFDPGAVDDVPPGRYTIVFSTLAEPSIVVERATTVTAGDAVGTSVMLGAVPRPLDGYVASTWHIAEAPDVPTPLGLVVHNVDNSDGTVTVSAVGSSGPVPVPGLEDIALPAASYATIDLTDPLVLGRELLIESTNRVFVQRDFPTGRGDLRWSGWAVPAA